MESNLEIAQAATLRPIDELAAGASPAAFNVDIDESGRTVGLF